MVNLTQAAMIESIKTLYLQGWSKRRIARELGLHRDTVARHLLPTSKPAIPTAGNSTEIVSKPAIPTAGGSGRKSGCESCRDWIAEQLESGLSAQRIYQDLVLERQFDHSYESVKRFVRGLKKAQPKRFFRVECGPGEEAQIDFGLGAMIFDGSRRRRSHVFRVVLSFSRKGYSEAVFQQTTETLVRCLENAFRYFGGVTRRVVPDNLKAAVEEADWYDPLLNPKLEAFCRHYGTTLMPTRPYTPWHKGKIERGIDYVKENALKGHEFQSLAEENRHLLEWEESVADQRIHGTTRQQVAQRFELERGALLPLPAGLFPCFQEGRRAVHRDGYVEVQKAYYEVPEEYIGRSVWVRWDARLVRIFNDRFEPVIAHARVEPGHFSENIACKGRRYRVERSQDYWLQKVEIVGPESAKWARAMLQARGPAGLRVLMGLLSLTRYTSSTALEQACRQALAQSVYHLRSVRRLLERPVEQETFRFMESHPIIRPLSDYGDVIRFTRSNNE